MEKYFDALRGCALFCGIADENLMKMLGCLEARVVEYEKKATVIAEGDAAKNVGIVLTGAVQSLRIDYYGNRNIVSVAGPSEMFCESFACAGIEAIPISVAAAEPSEIMFIECARIIRPCSGACDFHSRMIYNLMKDIAAKNIMFHQRMEITSKRSTREKLLAYLAAEAAKNGCGSFDIPFDRQELADYLEVDRSGLSAEISRLRGDGILKSRKNHFELLM